MLGKNADDWNDNDNAQLQRVPFMINIPGWHGGGVNHTYGGEIDVMPTLLHLLGVDSKKYVMMGQDLLSGKSNQVVAFRDKNFVTPKYSYINETIYDNKTDQAITNPTKSVLKEIDAAKQQVKEQLSISDDINQKDLLRFYTPSGFKSVDASKYNYSNGLAKLENLENQAGVESKSLWSENGGKTTQSLYSTDAPEKD